nr:hypothetical protein GCM10020093_028940 [Planobispora longispora]
MRTSISETIAMNLGDQQPEEGDDTFTDAGGAPLSSAALNLTYSWNRLDGLQSADAWRVTGLGNTAYGASSVGYDSQGRVSTIREPASGETPEALLTVHYATATTATATSFGDYAGGSRRSRSLPAPRPRRPWPATGTTRPACCAP